MEKNRLEAFSDGVLAIIITIMVLELKVPHGTNWTDLLALWPVFISYVLSFLYIGIYWGNHHHLMHTARRVNSGILLANLHLLFWLSLIPFTTAWMGENHFESNPVALYAVNLTAAGIAYFILQKSIERHHAKDDQLKSAFQRHAKKGIVSQIAYAAAIPLAYVHPMISGIIFLLIAILWIVPAKEIEEAIK
ncbi:MAG: TMEM175 family protein [Bacteroidota bacterium]